ncbi:MAG: EI24 domain-containing protein [Oligoflexales bacterium]|nr:EI24 domain-containing protein [Oligoflexales bacterium]
MKKHTIVEGSNGFTAYVNGIKWLLGHYRYVFLLFIPFVVGFAFFFFWTGYFFSHQDTVLGFAMFAKPDAWYWVPLYYLAKLFIYLGIVILLALSSIMLTSVVSAPIYEIVSAAVERELNNGHVGEISFAKSVLLVKEEFKKAIFILFVSIIILVIPFLNIFSIFTSAFFLGWEFYDFPMARRGWSFGKRLRYVAKDWIKVTTFGLWLMIPFLQIVMMPLAVPGGTILCLSRLKKDGDI